MGTVESKFKRYLERHSAANVRFFRSKLYVGREIFQNAILFSKLVYMTDSKYNCIKSKTLY